jgi:hypothetical protein
MRCVDIHILHSKIPIYKWVKWLEILREFKHEMDQF